MFNVIEAGLLRKAAIMVSKDVTRPNLHAVRVTAQTVEATNGQMAFRAVVNLALDEPVFLLPKRKLLADADKIDVNPDDFMHSQVVDIKGHSLGVLLEYFSGEASHGFPDFDRIFAVKPDSKAGFTVDFKLLTCMGSGSKILPVRMVPGKDHISPIRLEGDGWEAVIMPLCP